MNKLLFALVLICPLAFAQDSIGLFHNGPKPSAIPQVITNGPPPAGVIKSYTNAIFQARILQRQITTLDSERVQLNLFISRQPAGRYASPATRSRSRDMDARRKAMSSQLSVIENAVRRLRTQYPALPDKP